MMRGVPSPPSTDAVKRLLPWLVAVAFFMESLDTLQYTSMNTLAYADMPPSQTSMASTIASTMQQMSMSFGVAAASLIAAVFLPERSHPDVAQMIRGIHQAFLLLGGLTVLSAGIFQGLKREDGESVSQHHAEHTAA